MTDYTKEAELMKLSNMLSKYHLEVDSVEGIGEKGTIQLSHARKFLDYAARQQSAEIDRLRGEVERLTGLLHETWNKQYPHPQYVQDLWQQFKTENNIQ